jgi:hypothetical protein
MLRQLNVGFFKGNFQVFLETCQPTIGILSHGENGLKWVSIPDLLERVLTNHTFSTVSTSSVIV